MNRTDLQLQARRTSSAPARTGARTRSGVRPHLRLPEHCRAPVGSTPQVASMQRMLRELKLVTVCEEARCPNRNQCFAEGTATFMLLGAVCTRTCRFCNVATGKPDALDSNEPARVAAAVKRLGLRHAVITSVNRDDLSDGGSRQFCDTIAAIRAASPGTSIEVLTPDFQGERAAIDRVSAASPEIYNHNLETVPRLYRDVRPGARYERSLELLARVKLRMPHLLSKSGLMLGLGESVAEVQQVLKDLRAVSVDCLSLGQYLRPTLRHLPVERYLGPEEFDSLAAYARGLGFRHVASGPLVRSSFRAAELAPLLGKGVRKRAPHVAL